MSARTFLDTNVLVYALDDGEPAKRDIARQALADPQYGELMLSSQVLGELYVTVTRKLAEPLSPSSAGEAIDWLAMLQLVPIDAALVKRAIATSRKSQISYWDGLVVEAAARGRCEILLTEDLNDGQQFGAVRVKNPFREV